MAKNLTVNLTLAAAVVAAVSIPFLLIMILVKVVFPPLHWLDQTVAEAMNSYGLARPLRTQLINVWSEVFGPWPWRIAVLALAAWVAYRGARRLAVWAVVTITVGGLLNLALKALTDRARPVFPDPLALAPGESFPSGHAMTATMGAGIVVLMLLPVMTRKMRIWAWVIAGFLALSVAYTRVALGVHWVSDAVGGVLLGIAVIAATTIAFERWRRDSGRRPAEPVVEGVEPEAAKEISHH
ncbi:MAG: phosphatase PAP2 family protein [Thermoactinospora sp.]|nr:phosphatase PAP2 family protein [Thermoactinospora sp.]